MKKHTIQTAIALALLASCAVHAQQAVQWKVSDGGNGHWYQRVLFAGIAGCQECPQFRCQQDAVSFAVSHGAHLVSIGDISEGDFVAPINNCESCWSGLTLQGQDSCSIYAWAWSDGTPISPDVMARGSGGNWCTNYEFAADFRGGACGPWGIENLNSCWHDVTGMMLEFDADCNSDGIVDYGQCHDGTLPDYNGNNIPDCCERGEACIAGSYPVQWRTADGGNGHWYWAVADNASFDSQQSMATARGAMVVCVADAEENAFVYRFSRARGLPAIWIGMVQDPWGSEPDGGWRWIDGSGSSWRNWGVGEPNNWQYDEDNCVMIVTPAPIDEAYWPSRWQDYPGFWQIGAIIEWSADCNNDGVVDYGQILPGQLADTNTDGVPDVCQCATNPSLPTCCPGDLDHDAAVGGADIGLLLSNWGPCDSACLYDLNNDDKVNGGDLGLLLSGWGPCPN